MEFLHVGPPGNRQSPVAVIARRLDSNTWLLTH